MVDTCSFTFTIYDNVDICVNSLVMPAAGV
jgi:hypothetical protein